MNPRFLPKTLDGKIVRITEESGEVIEVIGKCLRVVGKIGRFGIDSTHPSGGPNNAALLLSELADLRHAISQVENSITDVARIKDGNWELVWTNELISTAEMKELAGEHELPDEQFLSENKVVSVCAGQWHREGMEWRFYKDPEWDDVD
jgi:hypothetical protein